MRRMVAVLTCLWGLAIVGDVAAQGGDGSLRGAITDEQGAAMPGVAVTATSPALLAPSAAVTDDSGSYLLISLPPGTYTVTAELPGFAPFRREGIVLRAGANLQVEDIVMRLGTLDETITVSGESPMLEVSRPSNVLNIDGEFQRAVPVVEGKFWSDFLQMTPGVMSRPHNDNSGRQNYFGNAVDHRDAVVDMEGMMAANYNDSNINRTGLSTEAIEDTQVKTGGVDAASPMGYGLVINMISKSGGNQFRGSAGYTFQPFKWNDDNTSKSSVWDGDEWVDAGGGGTPSVRSINQADFSAGGPIRRDRVWFFGAARWQGNLSGVGRTPERTEILKALFPGVAFEDITLDSFQPWLKVSSKLGDNHTLAGVYQGDRLHMFLTDHLSPIRRDVLSTGGGMSGAKLSSVWGKNVTTTFTASYNNKGGNQPDSYEGRLIPGQRIDYHESATAQQGRLVGTGEIAVAGGPSAAFTGTCLGACMVFDTASVTLLRGDLAWYKDEWAGSHQFATGFLAMPRNNFDTQTLYLNDGFILEQQRLVDPANPGGGTVPFARRYITGNLALDAASGRDRDIGLYVQDTWKPTSRLTATVGVRVDFVRRYDALRDHERQSSVEVGPRAGFSYLLTKDAKNVLRGTFARMHEQLQGGRHGVSSFGGTTEASYRDTYDFDGNGIFETTFDTPAITSAVSKQQFDPDLHQPFIDEWIVGYRRQFPGQVSVDVAGIFRTIKSQFAQVDINGIYPDGPNQPFGGFGLVDPNQGIVYQVTNSDWSTMRYRAVQVTMTKNLSNNFQGMVAVHKQWHRLEGTWNPTDPARFIQPDAFPNNRQLFRTRGPVDHDSYSAGVTGPMWQPYSLRFAGTWLGPADLNVSGSYSLVAGAWSSFIVDQLPARDPALEVFGPATVVSSTGFSQSNPLATRRRFVYPTRGEGQVRLLDAHSVGLKVAKRFNLGGNRSFDVAGNILNLLNGGRGTEYDSGGPNRVFSANFLKPATFQAARSFQLDLMFRF